MLHPPLPAHIGRVTVSFLQQPHLQHLQRQALVRVLAALAFHAHRQAGRDMGRTIAELVW
ncbi:hypothetical protein [Burkholderia sp. Se-20373]|uniref:hypothetical protein n=1 Tax=Burkholderia sp. Se-20373 TaxID=2703898 RepID=UPI001F121654|nr:hypothetical protein [Burkholderia sp. Se-20373]